MNGGYEERIFNPQETCEDCPPPVDLGNVGLPNGPLLPVVSFGEISMNHFLSGKKD